MNPALIIAAISAAQELISFIAKARADLAQNSELTPEQEADLDARIAALKNSPWWQPEAASSAQ